MDIRYIEPLFLGLGRMKKALFQPFDLKKWFVVGFTAFLAGLLDGHKGGGDSDNGVKLSDTHYRDIVEFPAFAWDWLMNNFFWFILISIGAIILITILILLTWISSRGKFMFLDNVVHDRAQVVKPWYEFRDQGNSLFIWRLFYGFFSFFVIISFLAIFVITVIAKNSGYFPRDPDIGMIITFVLLFFGLIFSLVYISIITDDFVVPVMYKYRFGIIQAWQKFIPLLTAYLPQFILYGILAFVLFILVRAVYLLLRLRTSYNSVHWLGYSSAGVIYIQGIQHRISGTVRFRF
ncbi:hypothetical protein ACFL67_03970 [candidate division KSB1 bacterium]